MKYFFVFALFFILLPLESVQAAGGSGGSAAIAAPSITTSAVSRVQRGGLSKIAQVPLTAPEQVVITSDGTSVIITWQEVSEFTVTNYLITKNGEPQVRAILRPGQHTFIDTEVIPGRSYTYTVRALTDAGTFAESAPQAVVVRAGATSAATMPGQTVKGGTTVFKPTIQPKPVVIIGKALKVEDIFPIVQPKKLPSAKKTVVKPLKRSK